MERGESQVSTILQGRSENLRAPTAKMKYGKDTGRGTKNIKKPNNRGDRERDASTASASVE